jgi:hypothetical protein
MRPKCWSTNQMIDHRKFLLKVTTSFIRVRIHALSGNRGASFGVPRLRTPTID